MVKARRRLREGGKEKTAEIGPLHPWEPGKRTYGQSSTKRPTKTPEKMGENWLERWRKVKETDMKEKRETEGLKGGVGVTPHD